MAENTKIEWTDSTFNPWWGCQKVSPACDHCYAERDAKRFAPGRVLWGVDSERRIFADKANGKNDHWGAPLKWAKTLPAKLGRRPRVFCASMADWLDLDAPIGEFIRLLRLIEQTPELDWLLLTKRIGNWRKRMQEAVNRVDASMSFVPRWAEDWLNGKPPANVWIGSTVVNQEEVDRDIPKLLQVPARVRFLSIEPMLGPINLRPWLHRTSGAQVRQDLNGLVSLDDEVRNRRLQDGDGVSLPGDLPDGDRLPAVPLDAVSAPANKPAEGGLQPRHHIGVCVVDGNASPIGTPGAPAPVQVPLAIEETSEVGDAPIVGGDSHGPIAECGPGSAGKTLPCDLPLNAGATWAKTLTNGGDSLAGGVCSSDRGTPIGTFIHWVIVGGESGPHARPMHPDWARSLRDQCKAAGVPFLFKQWGEWAQVSESPVHPEATRIPGNICRVTLDGVTADHYVAISVDGGRKRYELRRVGKRAAGRLLDGIEHNGFPELV